jgi:glycosyltransferase involved in cell wall biosynthesis
MARILHVIPYFVPAFGFGGPVTACFDIAGEQARIGHRVAVVTTDALDDHARVPELHEWLDGIEVFRFRNLSPAMAKRYNLYLPVGMRRWLATHLADFDVVHLHDYFTYQNVVTTRLCRRVGRPYVMQTHGVAVPTRGQKLYNVKRAFGALWGRTMLDGASKIIAVSKLERDRLAAYHPACAAKIVEIPNGLRLPAAAPAPADRAAFGLAAGDKVILSLSRLHHSKGIDRLIRALAELVAKDASYRLLIAGSDDGAQADLERLTDELGLGAQVRFVGLVTGRKKEEAFLVSDVFALFSHVESFAIAAVEALAYGVPVCLAPEVGVAEQLVPLGCAVIAEAPDDPRASAADLERVFARRGELAAPARAAAERYEIGRVARAITAQYT